MAESAQKSLVDIGKRLSQSRLNKDSLVKLLRGGGGNYCEEIYSVRLINFLGLANCACEVSTLCDPKPFICWGQLCIEDTFKTSFMKRSY